MDKLKIRAIGFLYLLITFCCLLASAGSTAEIEDTVTGLSGPLIDSIHIENGEIFAEDSSKYDLWIFQLANRLHIKTKKYVIRRELLLKEGDPFSRRLADETERNLRALPFLWDARVNLRQSPKGKNVLEVSTADSWTLLGGISISRTAGETVYHIRGEERVNIFLFIIISGIRLKIMRSLHFWSAVCSVRGFIFRFVVTAIPKSV